MSEPEPPPDEPSSFIEEKIVPLIVEPTLGPVWVVLVAHFGVFGAWSLLIALEQGRITAYLGVFGLFWLTGTAAVAEVRQRGRPGALSVLVLAVWATTLGFAFAARHFGVF
ncbi:MAG: hypothetical protein JRH10_00330 [Deltaproteobacteria bacterium]|nr:hypothetical protein [Deltaproteobacteria bacterium]MBW2447802.1 hypothetical protein [Deltaproteobacteria bacterium]